MPKIILNKLQIETLKFFGQSKFGRNFYWTGGTLLASKYLKHRDSTDLDFFSDDLFSDIDYNIFIKNLIQYLNIKKTKFTISNNRRLLQLERNKSIVKLELVYFPFPAVGRRIKMKTYQIQIDSLKDIMINKTLAAYQRNEPKDAYDLYFYLKYSHKTSLPTLIKLVQKKFGVIIEPSLLIAKLYELTESMKTIQPLFKVKEKNIKNAMLIFFQLQFNQIAKKQLK